MLVAAKKSVSLRSRLRSNARAAFWRVLDLFRSPQNIRIEKILSVHRDPTELPEMVIFIMDGNGRYADKHGKPKAWGHLQGVFKAREMMKALRARGIRKAGFWAAAPENF